MYKCNLQIWNIQISTRPIGDLTIGLRFEIKIVMMQDYNIGHYQTF